MLIIEDHAHFEQVVAFAKNNGLYDGDDNYVLASRLKYLETYGGKADDGTDRMRVRLMPDAAPHSFYFVIERKNQRDEWATLFNGGLLYHGAHDGNGSGSGPTSAATLTPMNGWSIHT